MVPQEVCKTEVLARVGPSRKDNYTSMTFCRPKGGMYDLIITSLGVNEGLRLAQSHHMLPAYDSMAIYTLSSTHILHRAFT